MMTSAIVLAGCSVMVPDGTRAPAERVSTMRSPLIANGVQVYVAYAENERPAPFWPNPWLSSPNTQFLGYPGPAYDNGAILVRNTSTADVVLGPGAKVDGFQNGQVFQLWDGMIGTGLTIPPGQQVILAQTLADSKPDSCARAPAPPASCSVCCLSNFDTSDTPVGSAQSSAAPLVHLTLNGAAQTFFDTGQILNTGGFDFGNDVPRNESVQWRLIGTTGMNAPGGSGVNPNTVTTWHNDNSRTGLNPGEPTLTPANVNASTFGKLFTYPVDGQIYAQPLFVSDLVLGGEVHDVVFVATENNNVYAFDANSNAGSNGGILWGPVSLGPPAPSFCSNVAPNVGVTGTPVIDTTTGTLYVVAKTSPAQGTYATQLHALDLTTGTEKFGGPVTIGGSVPGTGDGAVAGQVTFNSQWQFQRAALLLANGSVYVAFGSHCDDTPYHGWIFGYDAANLAQQTTVFNSSPNAVTTSSAMCPNTPTIPGGGAIWMAGAGPAFDGSSLFVTTGNGTFDANTGGPDYGDSILKLSPSGSTLLVSDYFTPYDQTFLNSADLDLGSSGPLLLPTQPGPNPMLLVQTTKTGTIYLVNRATGSMGEYNANCSTGAACDRIVEEIPNAIGSVAQCDATGAWSSPAYFNGTVYFQAQQDTMKAFRVNGGLLATAPAATSASTFAYPGATPSTSASGPTATGSALVWAIENNAGQAVLHAYGATDLRELYSSAQQGDRDVAGGYLNFTVPTVAGGKVFVGTADQLVIYGGRFLDAPVIAPRGGPIFQPTSVTLRSTVPGTIIHLTLDGTDPTVTSPVYGGPFTVALGAATTVKARAFPVSPAPDTAGGLMAVAQFFPAIGVDSGPVTVGHFAPSGPHVASSPAGGNFFSTQVSVDTNQVSNPAPQAVYQNERWGNFSYSFSQLDLQRVHKVRLHFAENYFTSAGSMGKRVFNVFINGQPVLTNFDIFALVGANRALVQEFYALPDASQTITVQFQSIPGKDNAKFNGIEVIPTSGYAIYPGSSGSAPVGYFGSDAAFAFGGSLFATGHNIDTSAITAPSTTVTSQPSVLQARYQSERYGSFQYEFASLVPRAAYVVRLHFAEIYYSAPGQRVFSVGINGQLVLPNFDIVAAAGGEYKAIVSEFPVIADDLGRISIDYVPLIDNPKSSGVEILPMSEIRTAIQTSDGVHYITAENDGGGVASTNRTAVGPWETFVIEDLTGDAFKAGDPVHVRHDSSPGERWYATADANWFGQSGGGGPGSPFRVNRNAPAQWETFTVQATGGAGSANANAVTFLSSNSLYARAVSRGGLQGDGSVLVDSPQAGTAETFTLRFEPLACPTGLATCGGQCVDSSNDRNHCGQCSRVCDQGPCVAGQCQCAAPLSACSGEGCVNLATDKNNCGACANVCPSNEICQGAVCTCSPGLTLCPGGACDNLQTDNNNCGSCGNACDTGLVCRRGICTCPPGSVPCHCGGCYTNPKNCPKACP